jgi:hypothetical protein
MKKVSWRELLRARSGDVRALAVMALFFVLFFLYLPLSGRHFIAADSLLYSWPLRVIAWEAIRQGSLPLWTPLILSGYPLFSMAQLGLGYPLTWGYLFLPGHLAEQVYLLAPFLLCPIFTFAYLREIGRSRLASLLGGLAFAYGGLFVSPLGSNGMMNNAVMWLPLMLIVAERARRQRFIFCLIGATFVYTMSVLTGIGQGFLYVGGIALLYGLFLGLLPFRSEEKTNKARWQAIWQRLRPVAVISGAIVLSMGVAAFQILETLRAARRSVRSVLSYETFTEGSFTFTQAWKSLVAPLYHTFDVTAYVVPLALLLAVVAVVGAVRDREHDARIFFWLAMAVLAWALMLGSYTPLYRVIYHISLLNRFRVPSRHTFEWTFAISVMSAYGWDLLGRAMAPTRVQVIRRVAGTASLLFGVMIGLYWWKLAKAPHQYQPTELPEQGWYFWKTVFIGLTLTAVWQGWRMKQTRWRDGLLTSAIVVTCFVEPFILAFCWWYPSTQLIGRFSRTSPVTEFLRKYPPEQHRVYTRVSPFYEQAEATPSVDAHNLTVLTGLHNVAGYEPLILERYSRALGNVGVDAVLPRPGYGLDETLMQPSSRVLDLLNTTFVVEIPRRETDQAMMEKDRISFIASEYHGIEINSGDPVLLTTPVAEGDTLALVTSMAESGSVVQGDLVAEVKIYTTDGKVIERVIRAGIDTAEWAIERPDVRPAIRHSLAPVFDSRPGDAASSFTAYRYWTRLPLGGKIRTDHVVITRVAKDARLIVNKVSLFDSLSGKSFPLLPAYSDRWQQVYANEEARVLRNKQALPRAWLVAEAESAGPEEALRRITGRDQRPFDPKRTVLLELWTKDLPKLPGGPMAPDAAADITTYRPGHLIIETRADTASVLVVSEVDYRGWEAWVDGVKTPILTANYMLRGVALPAGRHRVEMRYSDPALKQGAVVSLITLLFIGGLAIYARRKTRTERALELAHAQ